MAETETAAILATTAKHRAAELARVRRLDPIERFNAANTLIGECREHAAALAAVRRSTIRDMRVHMDAIDVARTLGITRERVRQIEQGTTPKRQRHT